MQTYINPSNGNTSAIDLTICNPSIYIDFSLLVHKGTCGNNHFPILLTQNLQEKIPRWKLDKAKWGKFEEKCKENLIHKEPNYNTIEYFTKMHPKNH